MTLLSQFGDGDGELQTCDSRSTGPILQAILFRVNVRTPTGVHRWGGGIKAMNLTQLPDFLTVEEAPEILRLKRSQAYELTKIYRMSGGTSGLPVVVFGRWLRVPK